MIQKTILSRNKTSIILFWIVVLIIIGCNKDITVDFVNAPPADFKVENYEISMEIDADQKLFSSKQQLTVSTLSETQSVVFDIQSDLEISNISIQEIGGTNIPVTGWEELGKVNYERGTEVELFSRIKVNLDYPLIANNSFRLNLEYSMNPSGIGNNPGNELLKFTISSSGSRALHPVNGFVPYFGGIVAAPFKFEIKYPKDQVCSIPGNRKSFSQDGNYKIEVYESDISNVPVFYIGPGQILTRNQIDISVEYILTNGQPFSEEIADKTFEVVQLFNQYFGNPGTNDYRVSFINVSKSSTTGESKGNAIYFAYRNPQDFQWNKEGKINFMNLISHEFFHNWNLWHVQWNGKLYEWFVEGGAGFMSSWVCEKVMGKEAGIEIRRDFVEGYRNNKGYNSTRTLENAQKSSDSERSLIYSYGALVWEQMRQKLGEEKLMIGLNNFFETDRSQSESYNDLFSAFQNQSDFSFEQYINQWIKRNAKIDLVLNKVTIQPSGNQFETNVEFTIEADRDYEILGSLGYKTNETGNLTIVPVHTLQKGLQSMTFMSEKRPVFIQLDPEFRVPQTNINNDTWSG